MSLNSPGRDLAPEGIRHLVLFRVAGETAAEVEKNVAAIRGRLEPLGRLDGVRSLRVGPDVIGGPNHWDAALVADLDSREALDRYQRHPEHLAAIAWMAPIVIERSIADLELAAR